MDLPSFLEVATQVTKYTEQYICEVFDSINAVRTWQLATRGLNPERRCSVTEFWICASVRCCNLDTVGPCVGELKSLWLWHRWLSRRGRRISKISWASRQSLHSLRRGDQCREDQVDKEIKVNRQKLRTVTHFKYLGSVLSDEGSKPEIPSRVAHTTAALIRLKPVEMTWVFLSVPRYDWCALLSHPSSCMLVNHEPSQ